MYWNNITGKNSSGLDNYHTIVTSPGGSASKFYELEPAVVVDVILDENHPYLIKNKIKIIPDDHQKDFQGNPADSTDIDYSYIGRVLVRPLMSYSRVEKEDLIWAIPMESNISEYPIINEVVVIGRYLGNYFYSKKLNIFNLPNANPEFSLERTYGDDGGGQSGDISLGNRELYDPNKPFDGPTSRMASETRLSTQGISGKYFWVNKNIRALKRREGDIVLEGRFGNSIRFSAYDDNRENDVGSQSYVDYYGRSSRNNSGINSRYGTPAGGGNPMILIRNRQRPLLKENEQQNIYNNENIPPLVGTKHEKNAGGYIDENINYDGSSIHITSGLTISQFKSTCYKTMFRENFEEQRLFSPSGSTKFQYPMLNGDQIVINSDRLIFQSRMNETFHFSKKRYAIVTDSEYTVDAHDKIVMNTNNKVVLNSPAIYLGQYDKTDEPILLGQTSVNWLYDLCEWLKQHTHWYKHGHVSKSAGKAVPDKTQIPVEVLQLIALQTKLSTLLSKRVFVTGGGFAEGLNGAPIKNGTEPVSINVWSGDGIPGGWHGKNKR